MFYLRRQQVPANPLNDNTVYKLIIDFAFYVYINKLTICKYIKCIQRYEDHEWNYGGNRLS